MKHRTTMNCFSFTKTLKMYNFAVSCTKINILKPITFAKSLSVIVTLSINTGLPKAAFYKTCNKR